MSGFTKAARRWIALCFAASVAITASAKADFSFPDFSRPQHIILVNQAAIWGDALRVLPAQGYVTGAAWYDEQQAVGKGFDTSFRFRLSGGTSTADGFAFVIQNDSTAAVGLYGLGLGYSSGPEFDLCQDLDGIAWSVAVEFDTFYNPWINDLPLPHVSVHTRGALTNCADHGSSLGASAAIPNLLAGEHAARIRYAGTTLSVFVDDLSVPVLDVPLDLAAYPKLPIAWVGFTSGSGTAYSDTDVLAWSFSGSEWNCPAPTSYCTPKPNSLGCLPRIGFAGRPSIATAEGFVVTASEVRNYRTGFLAWSFETAAYPFQGGFLCLMSPVHRTPLQESGGNLGVEDCSGSFSFSMSPAFFAAAGIAAGDELFAQYWSRDPDSSPFPISLTDALQFTVCP